MASSLTRMMEIQTTIKQL
ncbi:unnamed protein product, partial [Rhodiola kirilowii]